MPSGKNASDVETGVKHDRSWLGSFADIPVGGVPGNHMFYRQVLLALRGSLVGLLLGSIIWFPAVGNMVPADFKKYVATGVIVIYFNLTWHFGSVIGNATAAIQGTFWACFNIFMMRGFFPDGRTPEMGHLSTASVCGWLNVSLFNLLFLSTDVRMGVRMFAMANNTFFFLCFLNPADQTVFSKNFKINPNGTAVNCLKVTTIASLLACIANLVPFPEGFATKAMKENAQRTSAFMAKNFISSVEYFSGASGSVLIEKQMKATKLLSDDIGSLGGPIGTAWYEGLDIGNAGVVRNLHSAHSALLGDLQDVMRALEVAMKTEDFGPSHIQIMDAMKEPCLYVAESAGELLVKCTEYAGDGEVSANEAADLMDLEARVTDDVRTLGRNFNQVRQNWACLDRGVLNESFFVFALSSYARKVKEFSAQVRKNENMGDPFSTVLWNLFTATFTLEGAGDNFGPIAIRSWISVMVAFFYAVTLDGYSGACAITIIFFISNRVAPDISSTLQGLAAATIASALAAIIFSRACQTGQGFWLLPVVSVIFWWAGLYVHFSGCKFATVGLLSAALSPGTLIALCPEGLVDQAGAAAGLLIGIRGFVIALFIMSVAECASSKDITSTLSYESVHAAIQGLGDGLKQMWDDKDPMPALGPVGGLLDKAVLFSTSACEEPRLWKCSWKGALLEEVCGFLQFMRLDVLTMRAAMCGADGKTGGVFAVLNKVPAFGRMKQDFMVTLKDCQVISYDLLKHEYGLFTTKLSSVEGLDELEDYDDCLKEANECTQLVFFPNDEDIETIEDDLLAQLSIILVMMDYATKRMAGVIGSCLRLS